MTGNRWLKERYRMQPLKFQDGMTSYGREVVTGIFKEVVTDIVHRVSCDMPSLSFSPPVGLESSSSSVSLE